METNQRDKNTHRFIVDDSLTNHNSSVNFHPDMMDEMDFSAEVI